MRRRVMTGLGLGLTGLCSGVAGAVFSIEALGVIAALCAIAGCFVIASETLLPLLARSDVEGSSGYFDTAVIAQPKFTGMNLSPDNDANSVIDELTGFPDERYFDVAVEGRVAAARRHLWPVSIVLLELGFDEDDETEDINAERRAASLTSFAKLMRQTLRESDIACRLNDTTFGLILEDTSEEGGVWTAERLQISLSHDTTSIRSLAAGVAAYPTHGLFAKEVLLRANAALRRASSTPVGHGLGQVEVAHVDLS